MKNAENQPDTSEEFGMLKVRSKHERHHVTNRPSMSCHQTIKQTLWVSSPINYLQMEQSS
jgi:hypothetical protein